VTHGGLNLNTIGTGLERLHVLYVILPGHIEKSQQANKWFSFVKHLSYSPALSRV